MFRPIQHTVKTTDGPRILDLEMTMSRGNIYLFTEVRAGAHKIDDPTSSNCAGVGYDDTRKARGTFSSDRLETAALSSEDYLELTGESKVEDSAATDFIAAANAEIERDLDECIAATSDPRCEAFYVNGPTIQSSYNFAVRAAAKLPVTMPVLIVVQSFAEDVPAE